MSRYIDAENAIERLGAYLMTDAQIEYGGLASEDIDDWKPIAIDILKGAPSIDIVRCKECKYAEIYDGYYTQVCCENGVIGGYGELWELDDFCSYGERKESDDA